MRRYLIPPMVTLGVLVLILIASFQPAHAANQLPVVTGSGGPVQAQPTFPIAALTPLSASSGNVANASAVATLAKATGKTVYLTGIHCTASGATTGLPVSVTVTGLLGGTRTYTFVFPAGVLVSATPLVETFNPPLPASATNTDVVLTLPAGGTGNTNASCNAQGFRY